MTKPVSTYLILERFKSPVESPSINSNWNIATFSTLRRAKREYIRAKREDQYESLLMVRVLETDCDWL